MAFTASKRCRFPNDLQFAANQLDIELAKRVQDNLALLSAVETSTEGLDTLLDEGNTILDSFFTKNDASPSQRPTSEQENLTSSSVEGFSYDSSSDLKNSADVADVYGLLPDKSTEEQDEKFLTNAGLLLLDNNVYLPGTVSGMPSNYNNIKVLRRLYFALDGNFEKTKNILAVKTKTTFVHDRLVLKTIPPKTYDKAFTLEEIKDLLKIDYLTSEDIVTTQTNETIVLLKIYLYTDKSKAEVKKLSDVPYEELITNVFHFGSVDNSTSAISRYTYLGYKGEELGAILSGVDLTNSINSATLQSNISNSKAEANKLIQYIDFLKSKRNLSNMFRNDAIRQIRTGILNIMRMHKQSISWYLFQVSIIQQKDIISQLSKKHSDEKIEYLLRKRTDIDDLWLDPPDDILLAAIRRAMDAAPTGSTYMSNRAINKPSDAIYSQLVLLQMYAYLYDALQLTYKDTLNAHDLNLIKNYLTNFVNATPEVSAANKTTKTPILQGQPSAATPSVIITERMDPMKTFNFEEKKLEVLDSFQDLYGLYPDSIAGPLVDIITKIVDLFEKVLKLIQKIIEQGTKLILAMKKRLDSFMSKYLSLTGNGSFSNSLLKCAINWDIGLSTDIMDRLLDFFFRIMSKLLEFLAKLKAWVADILEKILCFGVDLLNNILGQVSLSLPSACKIPRFFLGDKLDAALTKLKDVSTGQQLPLNSFGKDIAKLRIEVRASTDKLKQFKSSSNCSSTAGANFMNASMLNVGIGFGGG